MRIEFGFSGIGSPVQFCTGIEKPTLKTVTEHTPGSCACTSGKVYYGPHVMPLNFWSEHRSISTYHYNNCYSEWGSNQRGRQFTWWTANHEGLSTVEKIVHIKSRSDCSSPSEHTLLPLRCIDFLSQDWCIMMLLI